jgi:glycosyltransferase involved in cell wall biosynthesis
MGVQVPSVSLLMPVYNAISDFARGNGVFMLPNALESILNQSFFDFELIILDNVSTDGTYEFLTDFAQTDDRIRLFRDVKDRNPEEAIFHLASLANSEYCCIVNDDDMWDPSFLQKLFSFVSTGSYDLVYPNGRFLDVSGQLKERLIATEHESFDSEFGFVENYRNYLASRNPIPISFGLFRTVIFSNLYPAGPFDVYRANVDNQFILRILMSQLRVKFVDEELFFYRTKQRFFRPTRDFSLDKSPEVYEVLELLFLHQVLFYIAIQDDIESYVSESDKELLKDLSFASLLHYAHEMFYFVIQQYKLDSVEYRLLRKKYKNFRDELLARASASGGQGVPNRFLWSDRLSQSLFKIEVKSYDLKAGRLGGSATPIGLRIQDTFIGYFLMRQKLLWFPNQQ